MNPAIFVSVAAETGMTLNVVPAELVLAMGIPLRC